MFKFAKSALFQSRMVLIVNERTIILPPPTSDKSVISKYDLYDNQKLKWFIWRSDLSNRITWRPHDLLRWEEIVSPDTELR